jgi:hypothetical protein
LTSGLVRECDAMKRTGFTSAQQRTAFFENAVWNWADWKLSLRKADIAYL